MTPDPNKIPSGNSDGTVINSNKDKKPALSFDPFADDKTPPAPKAEKPVLSFDPFAEDKASAKPSISFDPFAGDKSSNTGSLQDAFSGDIPAIDKLNQPTPDNFDPNKAANFNPNSSAGGANNGAASTSPMYGTKQWSDIDNARRAAAAEQLKLIDPTVNKKLKDAVSTISQTAYQLNQVSRVPIITQLNDLVSQLASVKQSGDAAAQDALYAKIEKLRNQPIIWNAPSQGDVNTDELAEKRPEANVAQDLGLEIGATYGDLYDKQVEAADKNQKANSQYTSLKAKAKEALMHYDYAAGNVRDENGNISTLEGIGDAPEAFLNSAKNGADDMSLSMKYLMNLAGALSDDDLAKSLDERYTNSILDRKDTKGVIVGAASLAGGVAPIVAANTILGPESILAQAGVGATTMGMMGAGQSLAQSYFENRDNGMSRSEALLKAKKDAAVGGTMQALCGAFVSLNEGLLEKGILSPEKLAILEKLKVPVTQAQSATRTRLKDLMLSNTQLGQFKHFMGGGVLTGAEFGGGQIVQNWLQGKDPTTDLENVILSGAILHAMGEAVDRGLVKPLGKLKEVYDGALAKRAPDYYDQVLQGIANGKIDAANGDRLLSSAKDINEFQVNHAKIMEDLKLDQPKTKEESLQLLGKIEDMKDNAKTPEIKAKYDLLSDDIANHIGMGTENIADSIKENHAKFDALDNIFTDFNSKALFRSPETYLPEIEKLKVPQVMKDALMEKYKIASDKYNAEREKYAIKGKTSEVPDSIEIPNESGTPIKFTKLENGGFGVEGITDHVKDLVHIQQAMRDLNSENIAHLETMVSKTPNLPADFKTEVSKTAAAEMIDRFTDIKSPEQVGFEDYVGQIEKLNDIGERVPLTTEQTNQVSKAIASAIKESITHDRSEENMANNKRLLCSLYENSNVITAADATTIYKSLAGIKDNSKVTPLDTDEQDTFDNAADISPEKQAELDRKSAELQHKINTIGFYKSKSWEKAVLNHPAIKRINNAIDRLIEKGKISENGKNLLTSSIMTSEWLPKLIDVGAVKINWSETKSETASTYNPRTKTVTISVDPKVSESQLIREIHEEIMHNAHHNLLLAISPDNAKFDLTDGDIAKIAGLDRTGVNRIIGSYYKDSRFRYDDFLKLKNTAFEDRTKAQNEKFNKVLDYLSFMRKKFNKDSEGDIFTTEFKDPASNKSWTTQKIIENFSRFQAFRDTGYTQEQAAYYSMHTGEFFARTMSDDMIQKQLDYATSSSMDKMIDHVTDFFSNSVKLPSLVRLIKGKLEISDVNKMIGDLSAKEIQKINEVTNSKDFYNDDDKTTYKKVEVELVKAFADKMLNGEKNILDYTNRLVDDGNYLGIEDMVLHLNEVLAPDLGDRATNLFLDTLLKNVTFSFDRPALDTKTISDFLQARTDGSFRGNMIEYLNSHSYDALGAMRSQSGGFYSSLERFFDENKQESFTQDQVLGSTKNLPQTEIDWIGLKDFVAGKQKITKQEILDYINDSAIQIVPREVGLKTVDNIVDDGNHYYVSFIEGGNGMFISKEDFSRAMSEYGVDINKIDKEDLDRHIANFAYEIIEGKGNGPKYIQYQLPGNSDNYREINLTLPNNKGGNYESSHWEGVENPVAHLRLTDRTTTDGRRILFVEEAQSDWAREGRDRGYESKLSQENRLPEIQGTINKLYDKDYELSNKLSYTEDGEYKKDSDGKTSQDNIDILNEISEVRRQISEAELQERELLDDSIADQPFKGDKWIELVTKKALQLGAQGGYDGVAFINGEQTSERYSLDKHLSKIDYEYIKRPEDEFAQVPFNAEEYFIVSKDKNGDIESRASGLHSKEDIEKIFGKDIAKKIIEGGDSGVLEGDDLKIKAEWARNLYDKQIPKLADKYAKLYGGKSTRFDIESETDTPYNQYGVEITSEMKRKTQQVSLFGNDVYDSYGDGSLGASRGDAPESEERALDTNMDKTTPDEILGAAKRAPVFQPTNFIQLMANSKATTVTPKDMFDALAEIQKNIHQFSTKREASEYANGLIASWKAQYLNKELPPDFDVTKSDVLKVTKLPIRTNLSDYSKDINFIDKFVNEADYRNAYSEAQASLDTSKSGMDELRKNNVELYQKMRLLTRVSLNSFESAKDLREFSDFLTEKSKTMPIDKFSEKADEYYDKYVEEKDEPKSRISNSAGTPAQAQADADTRDIIDILKNNTIPKTVYDDPKIYDLFRLDHNTMTGDGLNDYLDCLQNIVRDGKLDKGGYDFLTKTKALSDANDELSNRDKAAYDFLNKKVAGPDGEMLNAANPIIEAIKGLAVSAPFVKDSYGNISKYNLKDFVNFLDGVTKNFNGSMHKMIVDPIEKAYHAHLVASHEALAPLIASASKLTARDMETIGIHSLLSQTYPLHGISEKLAVELNKEFNTDKFRTGMRLKNTDTGVFKEAHDYIQDKIKTGIADSIALSHGEDYDAGVDDKGNPVILSGKDNQKLVAQKRNMSVKELEVLKNRILEDNGVSSIKELTDKIISGDIKLTPEQQKFKDQLDDTYTKVKDGKFTDGLGLERAALSQSGVQFSPIEGYTPLIRYAKETVDPTDFQTNNFNETFFGYSQDLNLNESFLEQRKPSLLALNTNAWEIAQKRIDQQLFYLLNSDHKNYLSQLFKTDLFNSKDGNAVSVETTNAIKDVLGIYYNRGVTKGNIDSMGNTSTRVMKTALSNIKTFLVGNYTKAPAQFMTIVGGMAGMEGSPQERMISMSKGVKYFEQALDADSPMNKFLQTHASEVFYRGLATYQIPMAKDGNVVSRTVQGLKDGKYAIDKSYGDTYVGNLVKSLADGDFNRAAILAPLAYVEGMSARVAFFGAYENYMRRNGFVTDYDKPNSDALKYATQAVRNTQHSTFELSQPMISKGVVPGWTPKFDSAAADIALASLYSFKSFNVNQSKQAALHIMSMKNSLNDIVSSKGADKEAISNLGNSAQSLAWLHLSRALFLAMRTAAAPLTYGAIASAMYANDNSDKLKQRVKASFGDAMDLGNILYKTSIDEFAQSDLIKTMANSLGQFVYNKVKGNDSTPDNMRQTFYDPNEKGSVIDGGVLFNAFSDMSDKASKAVQNEKTTATDMRLRLLQPTLMFLNMLHPIPLAPEVATFAKEMDKQERLKAYPVFKPTVNPDNSNSIKPLETH